MLCEKLAYDGEMRHLTYSRLLSWNRSIRRVWEFPSATQAENNENMINAIIQHDGLEEWNISKRI